MPFELHVALRYLLARRRQAFISVIAFVSILGVAVGVMALVIALALLTGLEEELRNGILSATAHVYVTKQGGFPDYRAEVAKLRTVPHVKAGAPAIIGRTLLTSEEGQALVTIKGIDPVLESTVSDLKKAVVAGDLAALDPSSEGEADGIFLGRQVAADLHVSVGDSVRLLRPEGSLSPFGGMLPRMRRLRVAGILYLGFYEYDSTYGFVSLTAAESIFNRSQPNVVQLTLDDIYAAPQVAAAIPARLGPQYIASDWTVLNRPLFSALTLQRFAISIAIGLIVMVAALNIVASLVLLVMEKNPDIAILKTMGASSRSVMYVFMLQGVIIGSVGTLLGASAGAACSWILDRYRVIAVPGDVYQVTYLPFHVVPRDVIEVVAAAVLICFVATIYPSRQAARLKPVEALRYG